MVGVGALAAQRIAELALARRHERAARARGAVEHGAGHYPVIVALHASWMAGTVVEGCRTRRVLLPPLVVVAAAQALRYWTIVTLGPQWTTRVIVDPTAQPVVDGPYRWLRHPNYVAVAAEIAALPLVFGAWRTALAFTAADALVLRHRIEVEDRARSTRPGGSRPA